MYGSNYGRNEPVKTTLERTKEQYEKVFKESWNESSAEKIKALKHIRIDDGYNNFNVSSSPTGHYSEKTLPVDDEVLGYLYNQLGVCFDTLRISSALVEGIGGKYVPDMDMVLGGKDMLATTIVVDAGIAGLSKLTFDYYPDNDEQRERSHAEAATIIRRSASTLRKLKCTTDGAQYVKMLPTVTTLEKLVVGVSDYQNAPGWKLDDLVTILRANAAEIRINIKAKAACKKVEYSAHETGACRKLTLVRNNADTHLENELRMLLKCVNSVCTHLGSLDVILEGHVDVDEDRFKPRRARDPFPGMLDKRVAAYKKLLATVPFNFPAKFHVDFTVSYEYAYATYDKWDDHFVEHFKKEYKNVTETKWDPHMLDPAHYLQSHEDLGEGRVLDVSVKIEVLPNPADDYHYDGCGGFYREEWYN